jgi:hypothetical protein
MLKKYVFKTSKTLRNAAHGRAIDQSNQILMKGNKSEAHTSSKSRQESTELDTLTDRKNYHYEEQYAYTFL